MKENVLLSVNNLKKTFKGEVSPSLSDISLQLKKGQKAALIGPDGAGKTTFLRIASGLILPDNDYNKTSSILIDGLSPFLNHEEVKKDIGYMPQKFGLYEDLTVMENLEFYAGLKNIDKKRKKEIFDELLNFAGLIDFKERYAGRLSGGMKQKLGLSCVLLSKPKLLLLDEPSVGVDPVSRRDLLSITDKLAKENSIGVIWATSYLDEAQYFEKVFLFSKGKKIYDGTTDNAKTVMEGLVYKTEEKSEDKRALLNEIVNKDKGLVDAVIEGDFIRLVYENKKDAMNSNFKIKQTPPVFEDFVMSALNSEIKPDNTVLKKISLSPPEDIAIEAKHLTKIYKTKNKEFVAADDINFKIKKGEIFGLLGPNGAGKSTTFKMLCSLIKPTSGSSSIMGLDINKNPIEAKRNFGYMAQKFSLFGNLSVRQNLDFFAGVYGLSGKEKKEKINSVIESFELKNYLDYDLYNIPLGFKQRLSLSCAVIHNPAVLFLDEPTSGVDPVSRREFWMRINNLVKYKTTVLVTTHFMDEAQFCDRIALVYKGKILKTDTPDNLKNSVKSNKNPDPTMEDAFIEIIQNAKAEQI